MISYIFIQFEYILRIIIAGVCGGIIGYERKSRGKGAGIRTHLLVAIASTLMMVISKYGFVDLPINELGVRGADPSRIAAQIVSGIGFLGAGMIYFSKKSPKGLTTAAGIWATAGVGMAIGAGMYIIGLVTTFIIVFCQIVLHKNLKILQMPNEQTILFVIRNTDESIEHLKNLLEKNEMSIEELNFKKLENEFIEIKAEIVMPQNYNFVELLDIARDDSQIESISMN